MNTEKTINEAEGNAVLPLVSHSIYLVINLKTDNYGKNFKN